MSCLEFNDFFLKSRKGGFINIDRVVEGDFLTCFKESLSKKFAKPGKDYCGECDLITGHFLSHYVCCGELYVRLDDNVSLISDITIQHGVRLGRGMLVIKFPGKEDVHLSYKLLDSWKEFLMIVLSFDKPDAEDIDYGLFLYNIKNDINRQNIIINTYMNEG